VFALTAFNRTSFLLSAEPACVVVEPLTTDGRLTIRFTERQRRLWPCGGSNWKSKRSKKQHLPRFWPELLPRHSQGERRGTGPSL